MPEATLARLRLFVAVVPDPATRARVARHCARHAALLAGARLTAVDHLHVTLCFLGGTEAARVPQVTTALERSGAGAAPFALELSGAGAFPGARRAKVVWLGAGEGAAELCALAARVRAELRASELAFDDEHAFTAHLTIARSRDTLDATAFVKASRDLRARSEVTRLALLRSHTTPHGARYELLRAFSLSGSKG